MWGEDTLKVTHTLTVFRHCHTPSCWALTSHKLLQLSFWMREAGPVESPEILGGAWVTTDMREVGAPHQDVTDPLSLVTPGGPRGLGVLHQRQSRPLAGCHPRSWGGA